jgi:hypothetical protein
VDGTQEEISSKFQGEFFWKKKSPVEMEAGHVVGAQEEIFSKLQEL